MKGICSFVLQCFLGPTQVPSGWSCPKQAQPAPPQCHAQWGRTARRTGCHLRAMEINNEQRKEKSRAPAVPVPEVGREGPESFAWTDSGPLVAPFNLQGTHGMCLSRQPLSVPFLRDLHPTEALNCQALSAPVKTGLDFSSRPETDTFPGVILALAPGPIPIGSTWCYFKNTFYLKS